MRKRRLYDPIRIIITGTFVLLAGRYNFAQDKIKIDWNKQEIVSKTVPTLQLVENPMVRPSSPIHKTVFNALENLGASYARFVPWFPYPKLAVAELNPPTADETFWDFRYIDSTMVAFMKATKGFPVMINFSTTPAWMWKTNEDVKYPDDPYKTCWEYNQGTELRDTTLKEVSDYFARLISWYTKGGFTDELGKFHKSGHFYKISYWEVLNEPDLEHNISPQLYTKMYDAIVIAMKKVSPETKFVGLSLAFTNNPEWFEYFLNPDNHRKDIPLDGISYHFYGWKDEPDQSLESYQYSFFNLADGFLNKVRYIENIRKRLAPHAFTAINEIGTILSRDGDIPIPASYWNLSGALYAYIYLELTKLGIEIAGESQLVGFPTQFPSVSMMNWENGNPNARYRILKLLKDNFGPGDILVTTDINTPSVAAQGIVTKEGNKILLINKRNEEVKLQLPPDVKSTIVSYVDVSTGENPPAQVQIQGNSIVLRPFSVAVIKL